MQLTSFTDYGLRSLIYLASKPERVCSVKEISEYYNISLNHLVKVIHRLAQLGYINSSKGKGGGIKLAFSPSSMKLGDIIEKLEPNMDIVECFNKNTNSCRITNSCQFKHFIKKASEAFIKTLNNYTLEDAMITKTIQIEDKK
ncbi:Rrf2 family transcriptional regulator [Rickettsia hoogstraalii]|uniref:Rrf2 family transcriptional regulator n=1 Tax=Rickettsia hoogstraalii TaxID=467174 RepID=UPI00058D4F18|nr:Rrf2 family transcriptional regulator [Rickettsia hoogstraalii]MCX4083838.1 Rrf2 family transcriptional regulator [Rickettsia hoogstraalii]